MKEAPKIEKIWDLIHRNNKYIIPNYQRQYTWNKRDWEVLWHDIINIKKNEYFLGVTLYAPQKGGWSSKLESYYLIDGHQRFATLILLSRTISIFCNELGFNYEFDDSLCTFEYQEYGGLNIEKTRWNNALKIAKTPNQKTQNKYEKVILFFYKKLIGNFKNENKFNSFIEKIKKLWIVSVMIEQDKFSPQDVFDSLNSKGKALNDFERINNFVIITENQLNASNRTKINKIWGEIYNSICKENNSAYGSKFIRVFLLFYTNSHIVNYLTYNSFRNIYNKNFKGSENENKYVRFLDTLNKCLEFYIIIDTINPKTFDNRSFFKGGEHADDIGELVYHIKTISKSSILLLLLLFVEFKIHNTLKRGQFLLILKRLYSFVMRRNICDLGRNENVVFEDICKKILKVKERNFSRKEENLPVFLEKVDYSIKSEVFKIFDTLLTKDGKRERFPNDKEFREALVSFDFKNRKTVLKLMLLWINKKWWQDVVNIQKVHIEHIFPQKIDNTYKKEAKLDSDEELEYLKNNLNNIGNLSILYGKLNKIMSNKPLFKKIELFENKNNGLHINSNFLIDLKKEYKDWYHDCRELNFNRKAFDWRQKWIVNYAIERWPIKPTS